MNNYRLRPAYGNKELLIEFTSVPDKKDFISNLALALVPIQVVIIGFENLWMNDETLIKANSNFGSFEISFDTWGLVFILAKDSEDLILRIDSLLADHSEFKKETVNFKGYESNGE